MKSKQIRQYTIPAALVAVVGFSVWHGATSQQIATRANPVADAGAHLTQAAAPEIATNDVSETDVPQGADVDSADSPTMKVIFSALEIVTGQPIDLNGPAYLNAGMTGERVTGRKAEIDSEAFASLSDVWERDTVSFPSFAGQLHGVVEVAVVDDDGWRRIGGPLEGDRVKGWFSFGFNGREARGLVRLNGEKLAYEIAPSAARATKAQMTERPLSDFVCLSLPHAAAVLPSSNRTAAAAAAAIVTPILNSRPAATAQILMDFDGDTVNDVEWGRIVAPASLMLFLGKTYRTDRKQLLSE